MPVNHAGRMIDHVHLRTQDLDAARRFYGAVLEIIGVPLNDGGEYLQADELFIDKGEPRTHVHLAFQAKDRDMVHRFYDAALKAGGKDNGGPGERDYHPGYYAAFVFDPDGNNIEAVFHGEAKRSAPSVEISWDAPG